MRMRLRESELEKKQQARDEEEETGWFSGPSGKRVANIITYGRINSRRSKRQTDWTARSRLRSTFDVYRQVDSARDPCPDDATFIRRGQHRDPSLVLSGRLAVPEFARSNSLLSGYPWALIVPWMGSLM